MDQKLSYEEIGKCCVNRFVRHRRRSPRCTWCSGHSWKASPRCLLTQPKLTTLRVLEMHTSGLELWRLLKYNVDRASAFNVISILESIRKMQAAKNTQDVMSKVIAFQRRHQECCRQAVWAKEFEVVNMRHQCLPRGVQESGLGESASSRDSQGGGEEHAHRLRERLILRDSRRGYDGRGHTS